MHSKLCRFENTSRTHKYFMNIQNLLTLRFVVLNVVGIQLLCIHEFVDTAHGNARLMKSNYFSRRGCNARVSEHQASSWTSAKLLENLISRKICNNVLRLLLCAPSGSGDAGNIQITLRALSIRLTGWRRLWIPRMNLMNISARASSLWTRQHCCPKRLHPNKRFFAENLQ